MVQHHHIIGYDNFCRCMENFNSGGLPVYIYFCGTKVEKGESWCSDCNEAWPVVAKELEKAESDFHFIYVEVGDRAFWKDQMCPFRTDMKTKLMQLPTIVHWGGPEKLEGEQCAKPELVAMIFAPED